jgi:predicted dehydrogenase
MRVAVIGCGFQGAVHLASLQKIPEVDIAGVCDTDPQRADALGKRFGVAARFADHRRLLDRQELDLVTVCTMPDSHREIAVDALAAGANVLCEKPLALSVDEGHEMVEAARRAERMLTVGFNMRYTDHARRLKNVVDAGDLGKPLYARAWARASEPPWWGPHYEKARSGGGAFAATAVHLLDLTLWMAGFPKPVSVAASMATVFPRKRAETAPSEDAARAYDVDDLMSALVRFESGFWVTVEGAWVWDRPGWDYSFELQGESALIEFDPLRATAERDGKLVDITPPVERPIDWTLDFPISVAREIEDVVAAIGEGREPLIRADEALIVQAISDAIDRSAKSGRDVPIPLDWAS